jgi:hypothetical protein
MKEPRMASRLVVDIKTGAFECPENLFGRERRESLH